MKTLIESKEIWNKVKGNYNSRTFHRYYFQNEDTPKNFPCIIVEHEDSVEDTYSTAHTIYFVYLADFQNLK